MKVAYAYAMNAADGPVRKVAYASVMKVAYAYATKAALKQTTQQRDGWPRRENASETRHWAAKPAPGRYTLEVSETRHQARITDVGTCEEAAARASVGF